MSRTALAARIGCALVLGGLSVTGSTLAGQSTFTLGFEGPDVITGEFGTKVEQTYYLTLLGSDPDPGAEPHASAWSLGIQAEGAEVDSIGVDIDSIGVDRTWGEQARASGFLRAELTTGPGNAGAVLQAIHSLDPPASLPVGSPRRLAAVVLTVSIPAREGSLELRYVDGLHASFGGVDNVIEEDGHAVRPPLTTRTVRVRSPTQYASSLFSLRFDGPFSLDGEPGSLVKGAFQCVLSGNDREKSLAEAWSIGLEALGSTITGIDLQGTDVESALTTGFVRNELTAGPGNEGAVSTVVLSSSIFTLDPVSIARVEVEAGVPEAAAAMTLRFRDGLQGSFGPIINSVLATGGVTETPPWHPSTHVSILSSRRCGEVAFGFSVENVDSPIPFDRVVGGSISAGEAIIPVREGEAGATEVYASLVSMLSQPAGDNCNEHGTFSWSFAVALDGDADPVSASFTGTAAERFMGGGGFAEARILDPDLNEGRKGVISGVILSFQAFSCLPAVGTVAALRMVIASSGPQESEETEARLSFADTLKVQGGSVHNSYLGPGDRSLPPCNLDRAALTLRFRKGSSLFQRGDANADRGVNLSDPVGILGGLFLGDPLVACPDAADADDNGVVSVTDAIYLLRYLFMSGPPPPPPFGKCGADPGGDADGIGCLVLEPRCP